MQVNHKGFGLSTVLRILANFGQMRRWHLDPRYLNRDQNYKQSDPWECI